MCFKAVKAYVVNTHRPLAATTFLLPCQYQSFYTDLGPAAINQGSQHDSGFGNILRSLVGSAVGVQLRTVTPFLPELSITNSSEEKSKKYSVSFSLFKPDHIPVKRLKIWLMC